MFKKIYILFTIAFFCFAIGCATKSKKTISNELEPDNPTNIETKSSGSGSDSFLSLAEEIKVASQEYLSSINSEGTLGLADTSSPEREVIVQSASNLVNMDIQRLSSGLSHPSLPDVGRSIASGKDASDETGERFSNAALAGTGLAGITLLSLGTAGIFFAMDEITVSKSLGDPAKMGTYREISVLYDQIDLSRKSLDFLDSVESKWARKVLFDPNGKLRSKSEVAKMLNELNTRSGDFRTVEITNPKALAGRVSEMDSLVRTANISNQSDYNSFLKSRKEYFTKNISSASDQISVKSKSLLPSDIEVSSSRAVAVYTGPSGPKFSDAEIKKSAIMGAFTTNGVDLGTMKKFDRIKGGLAGLAMVVGGGLAAGAGYMAYKNYQSNNQSTNSLHLASSDATQDYLSKLDSISQRLTDLRNGN